MFSTALLSFSTLLSVSADSTVVARVGLYSITAAELQESFEFGPSFIRTSGGGRSPLRRHLEYMVYERLMALKAKQLGYDTTEFVADRVAALEEDLAVDELYREEILSRIKITEEELEEAVQKARIRIRFRWIYAKTSVEADRLSGLTRKGASFDSLFAVQGEKERFLETTVLNLEKENPDLARELAGARSQEIRGPMSGSDGFYIVRIDEIWQNPIVTQSEEARLRNEVVRTLTSVMADRRAGEYVRREMQSVNPVIKAEGLNIVRAHLAANGLSQERRKEWEIPETFMTEAGPRPISALPEFLGKTLVTFGRMHFSVGDYLRWFEIRQFQLKTRSPEAFTSSIKRTIWKMVQDHLLSRKASERGMHLRKSVDFERGIWEAKMLYLAGRSHFIRMIHIPDSAVRARYELEKRRTKEVKAFGEAEKGIRM
ncbi:MAG TPA: peptidylprolyl isomerase, partial [Bacteroidota bacterium]